MKTGETKAELAARIVATKAFDAWASPSMYDVATTTHDGGTFYRSNETYRAWLVWLAAVKWARAQNVAAAAETQP